MRPFRISARTLPHRCRRSQHQIDAFRSQWYEKQLPVRYDRETFARLNTIPALTKWIRPYAQATGRSALGPFELDYARFDGYGDAVVPVERTVWRADGAKTWDVKRFERFEAPLSFFLDWVKLKSRDPAGFCPDESLYIAQCPVGSLPDALGADLPAPVYCTQRGGTAPDKIAGSSKGSAGGDLLSARVEDSSVWMGMPPTETPLHRDPNSNFLVQIAGWKTVRLMTPEDGQLMLAYAKREVALHVGGRLDMSMRGEEMMVGPERALMSELVWGPPSEGGMRTEEEAMLRNIDSGHSSVNIVGGDDVEVTALGGLHDDEAETGAYEASTQPPSDDELTSLGIFETNLTPGDALFIPHGWYHSVRSIGNHMHGINMSANWWFRYGMTMNDGTK